MEKKLKAMKSAPAAETEEEKVIASPAQAWRRITSENASQAGEYDTSYLTEFIRQKKALLGFIVPDRRNPVLLTFDKAPARFYYYHLKCDPLHRSFIINKIICAFSKGGDKKRIRNVFYELFDYEKEHLSPDAFYYIIMSLKPKYLNVLARRGREVYRAPILASSTKSTMKAIRFFKQAVMARTYEETLLGKIQGEMLDYMY
jgi:ribosomal protein S7